jgi:hypothetical protein
MQRALFCLVICLFASSAFGATVADQVYPGVAIRVDATTLTCYPSNAFGDFPVSGDVTLQMPRLGDYTELDHYPALTRLSLDEDCGFLPGALATAATNQGFLTLDLRVVLRELRIEESDQCRLDLVEIATVEIAGRTLSSERRISRPCE